MDKVLILGGTQFFGKRLVHTLLENGKKVTIATRGQKADSFGDKVQRIVIDREDCQSMKDAFANKTYDIVYDQSCFSPQEALDSANALRGKAQRYIFTSSQAVYDFGINRTEEEFDPYHFSFNYKKRQEYGGYIGYQEAKRAAESVLFTQTDFEVVAVRFPIVIGPDDYTKRLKFHVEKVRKNEPIGMTNPEARYSFIHSGEAAEFLYEMGASSFTGSINPGCEEDISLLKLIEKIEKQTGRKAIITNVLTKENTSPYSLPGSWSINTNKVKQLGFTFSRLDSVLKELIE
ncbi:NAD-dependent epimerase/dehydratase family protein [Cytobacillus sp.]|uniref:NAD-dependent epimerase/dehydratase family protein n=1 Tax=Cytobacillus sp. TaxID=2675269 RepID=UPI0028BE838D|nr:NAD-dependent epimerase/dehydratase family protein [Cytobacillus sp.]